MIDALNKVDGQNIVTLIENPKLPNDIYDANPDNFKVIVKFNKYIYWIIWLKIREPIKSDDIPSIEISLSNNPDFKSFSWGDLEFKPYLKSNKIIVETMDIFAKANFDKEYTLDNNAQQLLELLKQAYEFQILMIEK